jgi:hypothetical protein
MTARSLVDDRHPVGDSVPEHEVAVGPSVVPAIDAALARLGEREYMSTVEVADLLLDLRLVAAADEIVLTGD